jgi:hypothetical protein
VLLLPLPSLGAVGPLPAQGLHLGEDPAEALRSRRLVFQLGDPALQSGLFPGGGLELGGELLGEGVYFGLGPLLGSVLGLELLEDGVRLGIPIPRAWEVAIHVRVVLAGAIPALGQDALRTRL